MHELAAGRPGGCETRRGPRSVLDGAPRQRCGERAGPQQVVTRAPPPLLASTIYAVGAAGAIGTGGTPGGARILGAWGSISRLHLMAVKLRDRELYHQLGRLTGAVFQTPRAISSSVSISSG